MRRNIALSTLLAVLLVLTWGRGHMPRPDENLRISAVPVAMPPPRVLARYLGPFRFEGAWHLISRDWRFFGYSSMLPQPNGDILAVNDAGGYLRFSPPAAAAHRPQAGWFSFRDDKTDKLAHDSESVAYDSRTGRYWLGLEGQNAIVRFDARMEEEARVRPRTMARWGNNTGPEAMARLPDGRFITIREVTRSWGEARLHEGVVFDGDPTVHRDGHKFLFDGPDNFSVVDMALLPDGRALILMRRFLWPLPMRFAGRIVIADTAQLRPGRIWHSIPLASLAAVLPVDNFEAIGVVPQSDHRIVIWLMSDDNDMRVLQRTLLWKLSVDPRQLPWPAR
ncbi:esterase-like activity of phytase family protein [Novosphingobium sp.]|uniref:esterase-like activity of phytase family protein n=1 Tax=Novosphingobium sp. TaxID=1874826 RepID=UPI002FDA9250